MVISACDKKEDDEPKPFCSCDGNYLKLSDTGIRMVFPTAFTANDDGRNDWFRPAFSALDTTNLAPGSYNLTVLNTSQAVEFQTNSPQIGWNGILPSDATSKPNKFFYTVSFKTISGREFDTCGCVTVYRIPYDSCLVNGSSFFFEDQFDSTGTPIYNTHENICP